LSIGAATSGADNKRLRRLAIFNTPQKRVHAGDGCQYLMILRKELTKT
jgi:hypothetical protein